MLTYLKACYLFIFRKFDLIIYKYLLALSLLYTYIKIIIDFSNPSLYILPSQSASSHLLVYRGAKVGGGGGGGELGVSQPPLLNFRGEGLNHPWF